MKILIIGAGISGLFTAYELAKRGVKDIVIVEEKYPGYGGTLRNIGCFRSSFTSPEHVILMKESIKRWLDLRSELGFELCQCGYLWVARKNETIKTFETLVAFHNQYGVNTKVLDVDETMEKQPGLNKSIISGAMYDPTAGKMNVFNNFAKLYLALKKHGVVFKPYTKVTKLEIASGRVKRAISTHGELEADVYVVAAGGTGTREILGSIGVRIPIEDETKHPVITEPYQDIIKPALVIDWDTPGSPHVTQTFHGGIIFARSIEDVKDALLISHRVDAIKKVVKPLIELMPALRNVNILRYWIGYYEVTPDHHPIYGPVYPHENLYIAAGFSGHGLMMGPVTGLITSSWILEGKPCIDVAVNLTLERFEKGKLIKELAFIG